MPEIIIQAREAVIRENLSVKRILPFRQKNNGRSISMKLVNGRSHNSSFAKMAGKRLRLNVFY